MIKNNKLKYFRTPHLTFSPSCSSDDKKLESNEHFFKMDKVVITEKMDGENFTGYFDGYCHARSIDSNNHPSRDYVKNLWKSKSHELPSGWRVCAENLYAKHSIHYNFLKSYLQIFSIWTDYNVCLDWETTELWCDLLGLTTVPVIYIGKLSNEEQIITLFNNYKARKKDEVEGFVIRNFEGFAYSEAELNIAKFVRENHITNPDDHWLNSEIIKNKLIVRAK